MIKINNIDHLLVIGLIPLTLFLCGCAATNKPDRDYSDNYLQAVTDKPGIPATNPAAVHAFIEAISDLKHPNTRERLQHAYAETLYFNDTVHTYTSRENLVDYLMKTADNVESIAVTVDDIASHNDNFYLRWVMKMQFEVSGDTVESTSIGMSHIRLNSEGKVILHQDYWDGVQGLYRHIPFVGYLIGKIQDKM